MIVNLIVIALANCLVWSLRELTREAKFLWSTRGVQLPIQREAGKDAATRSKWQTINETCHLVPSLPQTGSTTWKRQRRF